MPGGYLMAPDTWYAIAFEVSDSTGADINGRLGTTNVDDETGETGWLIGNGYFHKAHGGTSWTADQTQTPQFRVWGYTDATAPAVQSAEVFFDTLAITFNEVLDEDSVPSEDAFTVTADGSDVDLRDVNPVSINGSTVTLALASSVGPGTTVTVSYTPPAANPLRDYPGNQVAQFENQAVTNNTPDIETGVIYEAEGGDHRVWRDENGHCYRDEWNPGAGGSWHRSESYGNDDEACRKAAWDAYRASIGQEPLGRDSDDFPTGHPPAPAVPRCPSGWTGYNDDGKQWCFIDISEAAGLVLSPERAREFVRLGLRPSDIDTTNELRQRNYWAFVFGDPCTHGARYGNIGGELTCVGGLYSSERPQPEFDRNATPLELVRVWQDSYYDSEHGIWIPRQYVPKRDDDGNFVTRERTDPNRPCASASWIESLWQWVCTSDGEPAPGTAIQRVVVREWDPDQGIFALKRDQYGNFVTRQRPDPNHPCASASWDRSRREWVCAYDTYVAPSETTGGAPTPPVVHPEGSGATINHNQSSHPPPPPCTEAQLEWLKGPGLRFADCTRP